MPAGPDRAPVSRLSCVASALGGVFRTVDEHEAVRAVHDTLDDSRARIRASLDESAARIGDIVHSHDIEYAVRPVARGRFAGHPCTGEGQAMELLIGRTTLALAAATLLATPAQTASAPEPPARNARTYRVAGRFLERDGKAAFLVGANYIPPRDWLANLRTWDAPAVEADMAALERLGVRTIRWFPLWPLTQPDPDTIDETMLRRVDEVVRLAGQHHIDVQISPLTGWMSGYFVLPPWARGDLFADPKTLAAEQRLVGARSPAATAATRPSRASTSATS